MKTTDKQEESLGFFPILFSIFNTFGHRKRTIIVLVVTSFLMVGASLVIPIFFKQVIDTLISYDEGTTTPLYPTLILWTVFGIGVILLRLFISIYADRFAHEVYNENFLRFYDRVMQLSMKFHGDTHSGTLLKKLGRGADALFTTQLTFFRRLLNQFITIVLIVPLLIWANPFFGSIIIVISFLISVIVFIAGRKAFLEQEEIEKLYTKASKIAGDSFSNIPLIKSFNLVETQNHEMSELMNTRLERQYPILKWWGFLMSFSQISSILVTLIVFILGSYLFSNGAISIGEIVMFLGFANILLGVLEGVMWNVEEIFWNIPRAQEFLQILQTSEDVQDVAEAKDIGNLKGKVQFENVGFSYIPEKQVLANINFTVEPGEKIALVGHTGSGKTTTSQLLLRFFEPQEGKISIDGKDISKFTQDSLRENIACVFQESFLFDTTIRDNIVLNQKNVTQDNLEEIAEKSHAIDFIEGLPNGFDTIVGERGVKLSGGEKQRIAIARAFLKDAPILILDEATSALDAQTEQLLQTSFDELMKGRTTFIIAHRLSTIRNADRIFVFEDGEIIEQGNYTDLVAKQGKFSELVDAQTKGFIE